VELVNLNYNYPFRFIMGVCSPNMDFFSSNAFLFSCALFVYVHAENFRDKPTITTYARCEISDSTRILDEDECQDAADYFEMNFRIVHGSARAQNTPGCVEAVGYNNILFNPRLHSTRLRHDQVPICPLFQLINRTDDPTSSPSLNPSSFPTTIPTFLPSTNPTLQPSENPTPEPTSKTYKRCEISDSIRVLDEDECQDAAYYFHMNLIIVHGSAREQNTPGCVIAVGWNNILFNPNLHSTRLRHDQVPICPLFQLGANRTGEPTFSPILNPSSFPTTIPTLLPSSNPTLQPSQNSTQSSTNPTLQSSENATLSPTNYCPNLCRTSTGVSWGVKCGWSDCTLCSECPTEAPTHMPTFYPSLCPTSQPTINPIAKASLPTTSKVSDRQSAVSGIDPTDTEEPSINPTEDPSPQITIPQITTSLNDEAIDEQESDDSDNSILNMSIDIRVNLFEFCIASLCILATFATLIYCFCKSKKSTRISSHNNEVAEPVHSPEGDGIRVKAQHHEMQCVKGTAGRNYDTTSMGRSEENPREGGHRITVRDEPKSLTDELSSQGEAGI